MYLTRLALGRSGRWTRYNRMLLLLLHYGFIATFGVELIAQSFYYKYIVVMAIKSSFIISMR